MELVALLRLTTVRPPTILLPVSTHARSQRDVDPRRRCKSEAFGY